MFLWRAQRKISKTFLKAASLYSGPPHDQCNSLKIVRLPTVAKNIRGLPALIVLTD